MLYSDLISFSLVLFSVPGSHPECHITINHHAVLGSSWLRLFLRRSLFSQPCSTKECWSSVLCNILYSEAVCPFPLLNWDYVVWEEGHKDKVPFSSHHTMSAYSQ